MFMTKQMLNECDLEIANCWKAEIQEKFWKRKTLFLHLALRGIQNDLLKTKAKWFSCLQERKTEKQTKTNKNEIPKIRKKDN